MADIFISYSRKDSEQALSLVERLRASGLDVWIDQHGIEASTSWSKEIANALKECHTMVLLLSPMAVASVNVAKELSVATQLKKRIVPIQIERVELEGEFLYHLSGLHRAQYSDFDSILRAITKGNTGTQTEGRIPGPGSQMRTPTPGKQRKYFIGIVIALLTLTIGAYFLFSSKKSARASAEIKRIAVLPFESLSDEKENEYFADGMTSTLIDMLMPIPELRVASRKTSMEFKSTKQDMKTVAAAIGVRYLVDGTIQRQGNLIMINVQMTDGETGKVLFSKSFQGKTNDFLELQKQIARSIVVELQIAFNPNGIPMPPDTKTSNPEAYNLCMKADFAEDHNEIDSSISYYLQATKLDTLYAFPYLSIAREYGNKYINNGHEESILTPMDSFFTIGNRLDTAQQYSHFVASWLATVHGDFDRAIKEATIYLAKWPGDARGYRVLGLAYAQSGRHNLAADNFIEDLKRNPMDKDDMFLLMINLWFARDTIRLKEYATQAIPLFEASLARHPDDPSVSNNSMPLALVFAGRPDEACKRMDDLIGTPKIAPSYILNAAAINSLSLKPARAMELMKIYIAKQGILAVDFDRPFFDNIRSLPEFQTLAKEKETKTKKNG